MLVVLEKDGLRTDDDAYKKAYTDAQSVACKALGLGADVYWNTDQSKYSTQAPAQKQTAQQPPRQAQQAQRPAGESASAKDVPTCACCGKPVQDVVHKGVKIPSAKIAKQTKEKYGRILCWTCAKKQPKEDGGMTHA